MEDYEEKLLTNAECFKKEGTEPIDWDTIKNKYIDSILSNLICEH